MTFQEKLLATAADWRSHAENLTNEGKDATRRRVARAAQSWAVLKSAGLELAVVARRHANRFAKQNSPLVASALKDVTHLARATLGALKEGKPSRPRKTSRTRTRASSGMRAARRA